MNMKKGLLVANKESRIKVRLSALLSRTLVAWLQIVKRLLSAVMSQLLNRSASVWRRLQESEYSLAVDVGVVLVGHGTAGGLDLLRLWV